MIALVALPSPDYDDDATMAMMSDASAVSFTISTRHSTKRSILENSE